MARPTDFTPAAAEEICERIAAGESVRAITADDHMPAERTVYRWLAARAEFCQQYARAREAQADALVDQIIAIADAPLIGTITTEKEIVVDGSLEPVSETRTADAVDRARLMVDARKWAAAKLAPKKYGNKLELSGDADNPVVVERIERVIVDPAHRDAEEV